MVEFCPHCGEIGGLRQEGQAMVCSRCGKQAGSIPAPTAAVVVNQADELIRQGAAARCPQCNALVELRGTLLARHFAAPRKLCPGSGKSPTASPPSTVGKDLNALMTRESIRVVSCRRGGSPRVEELSLAYLDKSDRVRVHIDALRDMLGLQFRMREYPRALGRAQFAVWASSDMCVVGKKHERGGLQPMTDTELSHIVTDLQLRAARFFT
jgi:DNA-directed RNA polymerase subunit RPC12/RpoP